MSYEITVGHYASHDERAIKHPVTTLSRLQMALFELAKVTTEKHTLQQVVFERDKVIMELRQTLVDSLAALGNGSFCTMNSSIEFLKGVPNEIHLSIKELKAAQDDGAWISVKDRLPDKGGRYLVNNPTNCGVEELSFQDHRWVSWSMDDFGSMGWNKAQGVTHWRELPTPPKEKG